MLYLSKPVLTLVLSTNAYTDYIRNTIYMDRALEDMRQRGMTIEPLDVARLSPIGHEHVNVYGKYFFTLAEPVRQGAFHPLCELDEAGSLEGDQEVELPTEGAEISFGA